MRTEYKYIIDYEKYLEIRDIFSFSLRGDVFSQNAPYPVSTVYYDTPQLDFYYDKINGEYLHKKARLRTYGHEIFDGTTFFEVKHKSNEDQVKKRVLIEPNSLNLIDIPQYAQLKDDELHNLLSESNLIPVSYVKYDREAFFLGEGENEIRLNFDSNISISEPNAKHGFENLVFPDKKVVVEVKCPFRGTNEVLSNLMGMVDAQRTTFSKYATGINLINRNYGMETLNEF